MSNGYGGGSGMGGGFRQGFGQPSAFDTAFGQRPAMPMQSQNYSYGMGSDYRRPSFGQQDAGQMQSFSNQAPPPGSYEASIYHQPTGGLDPLLPQQGFRPPMPEQQGYPPVAPPVVPPFPTPGVENEKGNATTNGLPPIAPPIGSPDWQRTGGFNPFARPPIYGDQPAPGSQGKGMFTNGLFY